MKKKSYTTIPSIDKMKVLLSLTLLFGISLGALDKGNNLNIKLYSETNLRGISKDIYSYEEDMQLIGFNNKAKSAIVNGIWLLYEETNFNRGKYNKMVSYTWGKNNKINNLGGINGKVSSIRYSGVEDLNANTLNFYEGPGFMGIEQYVYKDAPKLKYDNFGKSIIISGCKPWTLYEKANFAGKRICVYPASLTSPCKPGFFETPTAFGNFGNVVSSARLGCFSKSSFVAKPFIEGESKSIHLFDN
uniref:Beta/gamma crystallin 'Greek key' domain-containing protein n=1 Tax=Lepeophtheirus salmonis TaxID=72036 RepID=A0A0K2VIQ3_LEPSM